MAHGLMGVSILEVIAGQPKNSKTTGYGALMFLVLIGKAMVEALSGKMALTFLHFGLMGSPVAVSHAGGLIGCLLVMFLMGRQTGRYAQ